MIRPILAALALTALAALPARADLAESPTRTAALPVASGPAAMLPPPGYKGQWWTAPNRCEYSRTGEEGATVWYLIISTAHSRCDAYLVEKGA